MDAFPPESKQLPLGARIRMPFLQVTSPPFVGFIETSKGKFVANPAKHARAGSMTRLSAIRTSSVPRVNLLTVRKSNVRPTESRLVPALVNSTAVFQKLSDQGGSGRGLSKGFGRRSAGVPLA